MQTKPLLWFNGISSAISCTILKNHQIDFVLSTRSGGAPLCAAVAWFNGDLITF